MGQIEDLRAFVRIVELESIGKAAEQEGIAKSAMSRKLRLLEERLQTTLIVRTTRQWSLTEAGRQYYELGLGIIEAFDEFESQVRKEHSELKGEIRISVPLYFGRVNLSGPLLDFASAHPGVRLDIEFSDRLVDVVADRYDLVIRISDLADSTLIARELCVTSHVYCVSPDYLKRAPAILEPQDLREHRIIQYGSARRPKWTFMTSAGKEISVSLRATLNSHDGAFLVGAAERGMGIVRVPDFLAESALKAGRLVRILTAYEHKPQAVHMVYPAARHMPHRTRALMDFLRERLAHDSVNLVTK